MALLVNDILEQLAGGARREDENEEENIEEEEVLETKVTESVRLPLPPKNNCRKKTRAHTRTHTHFNV